MGLDSSRRGSLGVDFRVGEWLVQPAGCSIARADAHRHLRPMLMDLLVLLAENAGSAVSKEEILDRVWKSRFVGESALSRSIAELRQLLGDSDRRPRYIETLPKRGYRLVASIVPGRPFVENRLAVLPFYNLNHDPEQEYLADGIADLLTTELARVSSLRVISRQSVLHLKGSTQALPAIGRALNVDAVVEGSVLRTADRLRITAQLIRVDRDQHLWAQSYECELADVLRVQARLTRAVAEAIHAALTPSDLGRLSRARVVDPEAHDAYLKARFYFAKATLPDLQRGMAYLKSAIGKDPGFAPAWAELANVESFLGFWGFVPHQAAIARAQEATLKALALDDSLSEALAAKARLSVSVFDWESAEIELRRALELNRNSVDAHDFYGLFLAAVRDDSAGALAQADQVLALDPLSPYGNSAAGWAILFSGEYKRAVAQASRTLEMYPQAIHALYVLGCARLALSEFEEAASAFEQVTLLSPVDTMALAMLGHAYARQGRQDAARKLLDELLARKQREYVPDLNFVHLYSGLGDMDRAFAWLEKCHQDREPKLFSIRVQPLYDPLRHDVRFENLLQKLGLPGAARPNL